MEEHKIHITEKEEKLSAVAEKYNTTPEKIKALNPNMRIFSGFIGGIYISIGQRIKIPIPKPIQIVEHEQTMTENQNIMDNLEFNEHTRYRCEQSVMTYINGLIRTHADTKREFLVHKAVFQDRIYIKTELVENIINAYPDPMTEAVKLFTDLDLILCNMIVKIGANGKIQTVLNHLQIKKQWEKHKKELEEKYAFIKMPQTRNDFNKFLEITEQQIQNPNRLIETVNNKMFFTLFFDKYLVTDQKLFEPYQRDFYSQLFDGYAIKLNFRQDLIGETDRLAKVRKVGEMLPANYDADKLRKMYDEKYKPMISYGFSEFKLSYRENISYDLDNRWIESSNVTIREEVKNNVQILLSYNLKKIEY